MNEKRGNIAFLLLTLVVLIFIFGFLFYFLESFEKERITGNVISANSLVAHYKLDSDFEDSTPNNLDGTATEVSFSGGKIKGAGSFSGDDYIDLTNNGDLNFANKITLSAWIKMVPTTSESSAQDYHRVIIARGRACSDWKGYEMSVSKNRLRISSDTNADGASGTFDIISTKNVADNQWHLVSFSFDGTTGKLYIDGDLDGSKTGTLNAGGNVKSYIGRRGCADSYFIGNIDEARIYNYALSDAEILALNESGKGNLTAYYKLDSDAKDYSGNGLDGTATGVSFSGGKVGNAGDFNISKYVRVSNNNLLDFGYGSWSFMAWAYPRDTAVSPGGKLLMHKRNSGATYEGIYLGIYTGDKWFFELGYQGGGFTDISSISAAQKDKWSHVAVVVDKNLNKMFMYINGTLQGSADIQEKSASNNLDLFIGSSSSTGGFFNGKIDDVRIYNHALSGEEIKSLYDLQNPETRFCVDDDSGLNYNLKARARNESFDENDYCVNVTTLKEYYCENFAVLNRSYICPKICERGACVDSTCVNQCGDLNCTANPCTSFGCPCAETNITCAVDCRRATAQSSNTNANSSSSTPSSSGGGSSLQDTESSSSSSSTLQRIGSSGNSRGKSSAVFYIIISFIIILIIAVSILLFIFLRRRNNPSIQQQNPQKQNPPRQAQNFQPGFQGR